MRLADIYAVCYWEAKSSQSVGFDWDTAIQIIKEMLEDKKWRFSQEERFFFMGIKQYLMSIDIDVGYDFAGPH
jgi:hypothetical protein